MWNKEQSIQKFYVWKDPLSSESTEKKKEKKKDFWYFPSSITTLNVYWAKIIIIKFYICMYIIIHKWISVISFISQWTNKHIKIYT